MRNCLVLCGLLAVLGAVATATPARAACGDGVIDSGEQCDLGVGNCPPNVCCSTSCNSNCQIIGLCSGSRTCCASSAECPGGETCCGDGVQEGAEQCDDGNRVNGDCCSSTCQNESASCVPYPDQCGLLGAVNVISNPVNRLSVFRDGRRVDGNFRWTVRSQFNLRDGMDIDPDTSVVQLIFNQNDGNGGSSEVYHGTLDPTECPGNRCLTPHTASNGVDRSWRFSLKRQQPDIPDAPGWRWARIWRKPAFPFRIRNTFRLKDVSLPQQDNQGVRRARQSLLIGNLCITRLVECERNDKGTRFVCRDAHCGDGLIEKREQCGEIGLPACTGGKICDTCRCVLPLP